ncbi:DUF4249 domain-containing protein [Tenacibaculum pacificus]|uniref:DUF4249 domain-containing protein n=1 Tax=Tenacibaculum pacificus TaxID=3018314 RepID=UPI0022F391B5|nr:DUF4249 domain-containing protein [Tenacibaculum pacificus]WBX72822.1 DUF4249 domain-containing protein [Tenacibaculum pacificus]
MKHYRTSIYYILLILITINCTEPFSLNTLNFENILVVEASITDEFKIQQIKLSRTTNIESDDTKHESDATIFIINNENKKYNFIEENKGIYKSVDKFSLEKDKSYTLKIKTSNGNTYTSSSEKLAGKAKIDKIINTTEKNKFNESIVKLMVNSTGDNEAKYYRYEYEETYKIVAPYWSPNKLIVNPAPPKPIGYDFFIIVPKENNNNRVCYKTVRSTSIQQIETNSLVKNKIIELPIRYINEFNHIISHRYSILIKQYVQNFNAYNYFKTLKKLSNNENVFTDTQKGFVKGNIENENSTNEKVIGYFEVSTVFKKRIFFDYSELVTDPVSNDNSLPFPIICKTFTYPLILEDDERKIRNNFYFNKLINGSLTFYKKNELDLTGNNRYVTVSKACGDCTIFGSNIKPSFWID